jgi:transposase
MRSSTLADYYKEYRSNFRSCNQIPHSDDYIYFIYNLGESISIDETAFSNGEPYTIITNKDGHGKKGTLVAMIRDTKVEEVCKHFKKIPEGRHRKGRNITLDIAGNMCQIAKKSFQNTTLTIDRFHIKTYT